MIPQVVQVVDSSGHVIKDYSVDRYPDECPLCHKALVPRRFGPDFGAVTQNINVSIVQLVFRCPNFECSSLFFGNYLSKAPPNKRNASPHTLISCRPHTNAPTMFSQEIKEVSPAFVTIYNQAKEAQARELSEIVGPAYRKALEFLVKDYLINVAQMDADKVKSVFLGNCIKQFVNDAQIKACAERATWLGNDLTHYDRRMDAHDVEDLKMLIRLTKNWIENQIMTERLTNSIQDPSAKKE